jgi:lysophospholipase L1-like esterase
MKLVRHALALCLLVAFTFGTASCADDDDEPEDVGGGVHLSLGDSVAAGNGASDRTSTAFVALVSEREGTILRSLAVAGSTTRRVIDEQLRDALREIASEDVRFITISTGGNDLAALIPNASCTLDPPPETCPLDQTLTATERDLDALVAALREADDDLPIVLLAYPNFFSATGHPWDAPAGRVLPRLNEAIRRVARAYERVGVAETEAAFDGRAGELTHVLDAMFDPHPNDAGHAAIADAFAEALERLE